MGDPILLPDCPDLRARAEAVARERHAIIDRFHAGLGQGWAERPSTERVLLVRAALAELRDLSTPAGRDHACRWLWELLTGEAPEWCPAWSRYDDLGYMLATAWGMSSTIEVRRTMRKVQGSYNLAGRILHVAGVDALNPSEALAAAIVVALEWRRGQK